MAEPDKPDLAQGLAVESLAAGQMIAGSYEGENILLARLGDRFYAVGGQCTHYGGPLCEGLLRGKTVICPWHHARFDLDSGRATHPPALSALRRYQVSVEQGRVRIIGRLPAAELSARPTRSPESVVIIGAGAAGAVAAETLRDEGYEGRVTLLDEEPNGPVDRPNLSKDYLAGNAPEDWIWLRSAEYYKERGIELRVSARVDRIDSARKTVALASGDEIAWDALLLATGSAPIHLPIPGADLAHVFTLRSLRDARGIIELAGRSRSAVVVGASFIGLEVAAALRKRELEVHVVAPEAIPMERVLGRDLGEYIRELHEKQGVRFHLGCTVESIGRAEVVLSDGARVSAGIVVIGIGVRPNTKLAEAAGLVCDRGVLVDQMLQTSVPGIFAAGDLARWPDPLSGEHVRIEHWVLAQRLGRTAARNILGAAEPFRAVPFFWSQHYDVSVNYVGSAPGWQNAESVADPRHGDGAVIFRKEGRTLAVASVGDSRVSLEAELALETAEPTQIVAWENRLRAGVHAILKI